MNNSVTVGILSDSHGFLDPRIAKTVNQCDHIVHAGDIFNAQVLEQLKPREKLVAVAGNNDFTAFWHADEADVVNALPVSAELELPGGKIIIEHGHRLGNHPCHDQFRKDHAAARLIVYGHTHHRIIDQKAEPWVVNPGASGKVRNHGGPSCLVLHASKDEWKIDTVLFEES
ncbi:MAG: metallophosphoesterase family protein [Gammaproteobacteria bacterium]|nr:metallophosphoesterase family protein [Gammaproteobacteria bacterium]